MAQGLLHTPMCSVDNLEECACKVLRHGESSSRALLLPRAAVGPLLPRAALESLPVTQADPCTPLAPGRPAPHPCTPLGSGRPAPQPPCTPLALGRPAPQTPTNACALSFGGKSPPPAPRLHLNELMRAMESGCIVQVRSALEANPDSARSTFFDCDFEPVLCSAVRLRCSIEIFALLLAYGAETQIANKWGFSPLTLLASRELRMYPRCKAASRPRHYYWSLQVARVILQAGASPTARDAKGRLPADVARLSMNEGLADFFEFFHEAKACTLLSDAKTGFFGCLTPDIVQDICTYLVPSELDEPRPSALPESAPMPISFSQGLDFPFSWESTVPDLLLPSPLI